MKKDFGTEPNGNPFFKYIATVEGRVYQYKIEADTKYNSLNINYTCRDLRHGIMKAIEKELFNDLRP